MALTFPSPSQPTVSYVYRGFLLQVPVPLPHGSIKVEYQVATATDDSTYTPYWTVAIVDSTTNFAYIFSGTVASIFYQFRYRYINFDGTTSDWSDYVSAGNGTQVSNWSVDQTAASIGTITSGFIRGVIFETNANYPKVRMDPSGFFAINGVSTPVMIPSDPSTPITFQGTIVASGLSILPANVITGQLGSTQLGDGSITALKLAVTDPTVVQVRNGNFAENNPADNSVLTNGWSLVAGNNAILQTSTPFGRFARIITPAATPVDSYWQQNFYIPAGRHIYRGWIKTDSVSLSGGLGARLSADLGTALGTITATPAIKGTTNWTQTETIMDITKAGTVAIYLSLGEGGPVSGIADFANTEIISSVPNTLITPGAITTDKMTVSQLSAITADLGSITAGTITGATFQSTPTGRAVRFDSTGFYITSEAGTKIVNLTSTTGLNLLTAAYASSTATPQRITWTNSLDLLTAEFFSWNNPIAATPLNIIHLRGYGTTNAKKSSILIEASCFPINSSSDASISLNANPDINSETFIGMNVINNIGVPVGRTLIDTAENSDFLQLVSTAKRKINFGSTSVAANGNTVISHGIGATPVSVTCTSNIDGTVINIGWVVRNVGASTFVIANPVGVTTTVFWQAIG